MSKKNFSRKKSPTLFLWSLAIILSLSVSIFSPRFASGDTAISPVTASKAICEPSIATGYQASYNEVSLYAGICNPSAAIFDSKGNLWVADRLGRVLEFPPPLVSGENATLVIGQANFTSLSQNTDASTIKDAEGLAFDSSGNLWLSDVSNHRVLGFRAPLTSGMTASIVLGQPDFTTESPTSNPTASSFSTPAGLAFDSSGNLWVADSGYSRVLEFMPPFSTGQSASLVLGEDNFTSGVGQETQTNIREPVAIMFDSKGVMWVADSTGGRVLAFQPPFSNGEAASLVIGKQNFTQAFVSGSSFTDLNQPSGVAIDSSGNLWAADQTDIFEFHPPFVNGENASVVIQCALPANASIPCGNPVLPTTIVFDSKGNLWAAGTSQAVGVDLTVACCNISVAPNSEGRVLEFPGVSGPSSPGASTSSGGIATTLTSVSTSFTPETSTSGTGLLSTTRTGATGIGSSFTSSSSIPQAFSSSSGASATAISLSYVSVVLVTFVVIMGVGVGALIKKHRDGSKEK